MDEPDIPMLDVGDFEVLDECAGEDDNEEDCDVQSICGTYIEEEDEEDYDEHENPKRRAGQMNDSHVDENSGDNADNILDVSIDVAENEFLENVAKDFSENIEEVVEEQPRKTRYNLRRGEPTVQIKKLPEKKTINSKPEVPTPKKKPGPKSKTMNVQSTSAKKPIQKISFNDDKEKKEEKKTTQQTDNKQEAEENENKTPKTAAAAPQKSKEMIKQIFQQKTPAFLKKDLTDEEIMIHFDEIENTVLTSDSFVIEHEVEQSRQEAESNKTNKNDEDTKDEEKEDENKEEEENWDETCDKNVKSKPQIKIEEREFKESEMWYKEKIKAKENSVEERFTKLAKIIQYSYPLYKKWLDRNESLFGTAICKIESSRHIPLDQLHPNRWKFICNKKNVQQSSKDEEIQADDTSGNKNAQSSWQMIPGVADANTDNTEEYPPYVMRVVKIFEEFLKSLEESTCAGTEEIKNETKAQNEDNKNASEDKQETTDKPEANEKSADENKSFVENLNGLTVLLRCNRKEELMMHITGKNISTKLMNKIKDLFENGAGKDCNVKSLYCKTIIKDEDGVRTNNTFLFGSETLDDSIGNVKVQLAPKANVWANLAGVEVLADVVTSYLVPTKKTTVVEIGCGTGLISLLLASKCQKVIGVDVQKEIAEAEILSELNGVKNATFLTGKPKLVMSQIDKSIANSKAVAVINTNNAFGRSIEVISSLRQMSTLGRIIIITTLTKQAIRSILELTQPADEIYGNPFIPIKACIVDTTPKSFGFEIVMSMERRTMRNLLKVSAVESVNTAPVGLISKSKQAAGFKYNSAGNITLPPNKKGLPPKFIKAAIGKPAHIPGKKFFPNPNYNPVNKFQGKRPYVESDGTTFHPGAKKFKKFDKPYLGPNIRLNPMHEKKIRDDGDLRERLSSNRVESTAIAQEMQEQKKILDAAKEKLTGAGSSVDVETVKKLQEMLNLAIEKTNKLQSQLPPRSVWDRIAPPESGFDDEQIKSNPPMRGRLVKETGPKKIIITTSNDRDGPIHPPGKSKKYDNLPPLEPNLIMPVNNKPDRLKMSQSVSQKPSTAPYLKPGADRFKGGNYRKPDNQNQAPWNRNKSGPGIIDNQERWSRPSPPRRSSPPRPIAPPRQAVRSPPRQSMRSPPRPLLRSPPRQASPVRRPVSPVRRPVSPPRRPISPTRRPVSPVFRQHSSSSRGVPSGGRSGSPLRLRHNSPPRRPVSPHNYRASPPRQSSTSNRQKSPPARRYADEWDIPSRSTAESGWSRAEKEKTGWQAPPSSSSTNWDQSSSGNSKYRPENDKWDNRSGPGTWNDKNQLPSSQNNSSGRWKDSAGNTLSGSNWDVKKDSGMRDVGRHEPRHDPRHETRHEPRMESRHEARMEPRHEARMEPRHEPRIEPRHELRMEARAEPRMEARHEPRMEPRHESRVENRHEPRHEPRIEMRHEPRMETRHEPRHDIRHEPRWDLPEKTFRSDKDDWADLPEDARDPWGDNDPAPPSQETRWGQASQPSPISTWSRDNPNESNWSAKPNFPINTMGSGAGNIGGNVNANVPKPNLNMNMGLGMNNQNKGVWQNASQQQQQPNRNQNWLPPGNWQSGGVNPGNAGGQVVGMGGMMLGSTLANWQPSQQSFANFSARPFNNNPFMNNRR